MNGFEWSILIFQVFVVLYRRVCAISRMNWTCNPVITSSRISSQKNWISETTNLGFCVLLSFSEKNAFIFSRADSPLPKTNEKELKCTYNLETVLTLLPGQLSVLQDRSSRPWPTQSRPYAGTGLSQARVRTLSPPPHESLH